MKCPICDFARVGDALRCPNCQSALTVWKNYTAHGRSAYRAGLRAVADGDLPTAAGQLLEAVVFCPDEPVYLSAYGRLLGRLGRLPEATVALERAHRLAPSPVTEAALARIRALAAPPAPAPGVADAPAPPTTDAPPAEPAQG